MMRNLLFFSPTRAATQDVVCSYEDNRCGFLTFLYPLLPRCFRNWPWGLYVSLTFPT